MKITRIAALLLSMTLFPLLAFSQELGKARLGLVEGDVQVNSEEAGEWFPATVNTPLRQGDRLWVPAGGRSEIQILGGLFIRLDEATSFDILSLGDTSYQFYLQEGRAYINNRNNGSDHIQIDTPISSIGCYENSLVMVNVTETGATELSVLSGYAFAETRNGRRRVEAGNTLRIDADLTADIYPLSAPDAWEQWNGERDQWLAESRDSLRYLPNELDEYVSDFDANGTWYNTPDYGYVWTPTVAVSIDWAPYRTGRWVWFGGNYVWVSYEPWGWAPYHYGRWAFIPHRGWCWVPPRRGSVFWAPGYVAWVHTSTYVSWVPLAPGEIYYGHGNYGPGSVNLNKVAINNLVIQRNFKNINVRNAVTVMHRDTFLHGRKTDFRFHDNPFKLRNVGIGPPSFKPDKADMSPVIRKVPAAKLPPQRVRTFNPDLLRKERRLVTDERGSVFNPGRQVREMPAVRREAPKRLIQERRPERENMRQAPGKEDAARKERQMRQRDMIGPIGTDRPDNGKEKTPAVTTPVQRRPVTPAIEPRSEGTKDNFRRQAPRTAPVTPSVELPGGSPPVTPRAEPRPRVYVPKKIETPAAPQPVAPTPVWHAPQVQQPQIPGGGVQQQREQPHVRQPSVKRETVRPEATPVTTQPVAPAPAWRAPQSQQPHVRPPSVNRETVRPEATPAAKPEYRQQTGSPEAPPARSYGGDRGDRNR
jgi:hypothetical protein